MKGLKLSLVFMAAAMVAMGLTGVANAFHGGAAAECAGCHSMHSPTGTRLLVASDGSSTCLTCHERTGYTAGSSYHVSTPSSELVAGTAPIQRSPGGDFAWLKKSYSWTGHGEAETEDGASHGHSIVAAANGYTADPANTTAPGGSFPGSQLGCPSCHDPHGRGRRLPDGSYSDTGAPISASGSTGTIPAAGTAVGLYDLLAGPTYKGAAGVTFGAYPIAVRPSTYNQTEATNQVRIAYGASGSNTWGNWCGSCHAAMLTTGLKTAHPHPVDKALGTDIADNYNKYVKTGDMTGSAATAYNSLVPFAEATGDIATLKSHANNTGTFKNGPSSSDQVTCLSCHRAHASGWKHALRWNTETTFIVSNSAYPAEMGRTAIETQGAYYDRPATAFGTTQRSLCNKCHQKD